MRVVLHGGSVQLKSFMFLVLFSTTAVVVGFVHVALTFPYVDVNSMALRCAYVSLCRRKLVSVCVRGLFCMVVRFS